MNTSSSSSSLSSSSLAKTRFSVISSSSSSSSSSFSSSSSSSLSSSSSTSFDFFFFFSAFSSAIFAFNLIRDLLAFLSLFDSARRTSVSARASLLDDVERAAAVLSIFFNFGTIASPNDSPYSFTGSSLALKTLLFV